MNSTPLRHGWSGAIEWDGAEVAEGVLSIHLLDDDSLLLQITDEAAETLGLPAKCRLWITPDSDPDTLADTLIGMLEATGEFDPPSTRVKSRTN